MTLGRVGEMWGTFFDRKTYVFPKKSEGFKWCFLFSFSLNIISWEQFILACFSWICTFLSTWADIVFGGLLLLVFGLDIVPSGFRVCYHGMINKCHQRKNARPNKWMKKREWLSSPGIKFRGMKYPPWNSKMLLKIGLLTQKETCHLPTTIAFRTLCC